MDGRLKSRRRYSYRVGANHQASEVVRTRFIGLRSMHDAPIGIGRGDRRALDGRTTRVHHGSHDCGCYFLTPGRLHGAHKRH
jgi:hypothetical protein